MILYISGLNSTYKPYIQDKLNLVFGRSVEYYVIENNITKDLNNLQEIISNQDEVFIIGHSTGAFLALNLNRLSRNIVGVTMINPAINLLYSLDKYNQNHPILNERQLISNLILENEQYYHNGNIHPIYCVQGKLDDRVDIKYNDEFIHKSIGNIDYIDDLEHRFDEIQFVQILNKIKRYYLEP